MSDIEECTTGVMDAEDCIFMIALMCMTDAKQDGFNADHIMDRIRGGLQHYGFEIVKKQEQADAN